MSDISVQEAALLTGKSKETINKATNDGELSFDRNSRGHKRIKVSELERLFPLKKTMDEIKDKPRRVRSRQKPSDFEVRSDAEKIASLEKTVELLNDQKEYERDRNKEQIERLEKTFDEMKTVYQQTLNILTDQRDAEAGTKDELKRLLDEQAEQFDQKLSDIVSEVRRTTLEEIRDRPWWKLFTDKKLQA